MIWRELLCPLEGIPLHIDYSYLHKVHLLEYVLGGAKAGEATLSQGCFLPPKSGTTILPQLPSPLPEGQSAISRPALEARLAPLWILLVSKQIRTECSAIYRQGNAFDVLISLDLMSNALDTTSNTLGWDQMIFLFSSNTSIEIKSVTIYDIPRHDQCKRGLSSYWIYYPLTKFLLPLLPHNKLDYLRLRYKRPELSYRQEDGIEPVGGTDVPLDAQDIQKIEDHRDRLKKTFDCDLKIQCWDIVEDNITEEILVLSRSDGSSSIPIPKDPRVRRGL